jgi:hypothetical protein
MMERTQSLSELIEDIVIQGLLKRGLGIRVWSVRYFDNGLWDVTLTDSRAFSVSLPDGCSEDEIEAEVEGRLDWILEAGR